MTVGSRTGCPEAARRGLIALVVLLALLLPRFAAADSSPVTATLVVKYQSMADSLAVILPLLSSTGSLKVDSGGKVIEIRDLPARVAAVRRQLAAFDHPPRPLQLELHVFRSGRASETPSVRLPALLEQRLHQVFRYGDYELVSSGTVLTREGEEVKFQAGGRYEVAFRMTSVTPDDRLVLDDFSLWSHGTPSGDRPLLQSRVQLVVGRPLVIGLTRREGDADALFLAVTCRRPPERETSE